MADTMLRIPPYLSFWRGGNDVKERTIMGNVALAEELASIDEIEELFALDASESKPEDEDDETGETDDGDEDDKKIHPEGMPVE